jgi:hypothetical protein
MEGEQTGRKQQITFGDDNQKDNSNGNDVAE